MRNFKISIDLSDVYIELQHLNLDQYTVPFMTTFVEADNPDDACGSVSYTHLTLPTNREV